MKSWLLIGLSEISARRAVRIAGFACLIVAIIVLFRGAYQLGALAETAPDEAAKGAIPFVLAILLHGFAGYRLLNGEGIVSGSTVALLLMLGAIAALLQGNIVYLVLDTLVLLAVANGIRAIFALRQGFIDYAEHAEIFR